MDSIAKPAPSDSRRLAGSQAGAISLYVSFVIMVIISLISLTFAKIMSDRYRESTEGQYDLQAHYAAESAISSVRATIHKALAEREQTSGADINVTVKDTPTTQAASSCSGEYGAALDVRGDLLVVGAPGGERACVLTKDRADADWSNSSIATESVLASSSTGLEPDPGSRFGAAVAMSANGELLAIGAPEDRGRRGSVYIFKKESGVWEFKHKIVPYKDPALLSNNENGASPDQLSEGGLSSASYEFGAALAWDGSKLFVGAPGANQVYSFSKSGANWIRSTSFSSPSPPVLGFGSSLSASPIKFTQKVDGLAELAVGANNGINLFGGVTPGWKELCAPASPAPADATCGGSVPAGGGLDSFDAAGSLMAVGLDKEVRVLQRAGPEWQIRYRIGDNLTSLSGETIIDASTTFVTPPTSSSSFGSSVALHEDNLLIVGDPGDEKIYFFALASNNFLKDIWAAGLDEDCPPQEEAHKAWRNNQISEQLADVHYSCVSVEVDPTELIYDNVGTDRSLLLPLYAADGENYEDQNLQSLTIGWSHAEPNEAFRQPSDVSLPDVSSWGSNGTPILRMQITIVNWTEDRPFDTNLITKNTRVFFLYPRPDTPSNVPWPWPDADSDGQIIPGECHKRPGSAAGEQPCQVQFEMPGPTHSKLEKPTGVRPGDNLVYFVRLQSIYNRAQLNVSGKLNLPARVPRGAPPGTSAGVPAAHFKNIQAVITATGWSSGVGQRISERIPLRPVYDLPEYGIDSAETLCKILVTTTYSGVYLDEERRDIHPGTNPDHPCSLKVD